MRLAFLNPNSEQRIKQEQLKKNYHIKYYEYTKIYYLGHLILPWRNHLCDSLPQVRWVPQTRTYPAHIASWKKQNRREIGMEKTVQNMKNSTLEITKDTCLFRAQCDRGSAA